MTEPNTTSAPKQVPTPPAGEEDIQERIDNFNKELLPLLGKYELGLAGMAKVMPDGRVLADPIIVSVRKKPEQGKVVTPPAAQSSPPPAPTQTTPPVPEAPQSTQTPAPHNAGLENPDK